MDLSVIGGTGAEGFGLSLRFAQAGHHVTIGSRAAEKGKAAAARARDILGGGVAVDGAGNPDAAAAGEVVIVTVPFIAQADVYREIKGAIQAGGIVVDATSPLATAIGGRPWHVVQPWHGSAAEQADTILSQGVRMVSAFHTVAADALQDLARPLESDVLVCGDDAEAKTVVGSLAEGIPNLRWVDCGDLSSARIAETLTAILVSVNRAYHTREAGFRVVGGDTWGDPRR